jgi:hypothetical protein
MRRVSWSKTIEPWHILLSMYKICGSTYITEVSVVCKTTFSQNGTATGPIQFCAASFCIVLGTGFEYEDLFFRGLTLGGPPFQCATVAGQWRRGPAQTNSGTGQRATLKQLMSQWKHGKEETIWRPAVLLRTMKVHASSYRHTKAWPPSHDSRKLTSSNRPSIDDTNQCSILFPKRTCAWYGIVGPAYAVHTRPSMGVQCTTGVPGWLTASYRSSFE